MNRSVRLSVDHTHAGVKYYAGTRVELPSEVVEEIILRTGALREAVVAEMSPPAVPAVVEDHDDE